MTVTGTVIQAKEHSVTVTVTETVIQAKEHSVTVTVTETVIQAKEHSKRSSARTLLLLRYGVWMKLYCRVLVPEATW